MKEAPARRRSLLLSWGLGGLIILYALLGFVVVPAFAKAQLAPFVEARLGLRTSLLQLRFNPFTFTLSIEELDFFDRDSEHVLALDSALGNLQLMPLLRGVIALQELRVNGLYIGVHRANDGTLNLARIAEYFAASAPPTPTQTSPAATDDELPSFQIAELHIDGASLGIVDEVPAVPFRILIESIDFSLNNITTMSGVAADQTFTLALGDGSQLHWQGDLSLVPLRSSGEVQLFGPITDVLYRYFQAQIPVELTGAWFDSSFDYRIGISEDGGLDAQIHNLEASLRNLDIRELSDGVRLANLPVIAISGGEMNLRERKAQVARVLLEDFEILPVRLTDGSFNFLNLLPSGDPELEVAASATASNSPPDTEAAWQIDVAEVVAERWQILVRDLVPANAVELSFQVGARTTNISNRADAPMNIDTDISLATGGNLRAGGALTVLPTLHLDAEFTLDAFALPVLQPYMESFANISIDDGSLGLTGNVLLTPVQTELTAALQMDDLVISDKVQNEALFGIASLQIDSATLLNGERNNIEIGQVRLQGPYARVEIEADGSTNISRVLLTDSEAPQQGEQVGDAIDEDVATSAVMPAMILQRIVIEQASADFSDSSLPLPFAVHIDTLGGEISALGTQSSEPARVNLEGQVDDYGQVTIDGRLRPFDYASLTEIDLFFRNLDIPSLSPYVIKFAGRRIADGNLDVDLSYRINEQQLNGTNAMLMRDLELGERVPHPEALDLPLGLAIALLKDRNGVIDLDVPVTGNLENPQFSFGNVISRALANIITNIVSAPFRFLANLVGGEGDSDIGVIAFAPGRADLSPPEREKLAKLGAALVERPQLQLGLGGVYQRLGDEAVLQEQFFDARLEAAVAAIVPEADAVPSPSAKQRQALESLYLDSAVDPAQSLDLQTQLSDLQVQFTREVDGQASQLDTLAYNEALRQALVAKEPVSTADLERLAWERAASIESALIGIDTQLASRIQRESNAHEVRLAEGRIPLEMKLSALSN